MRHRLLPLALVLGLAGCADSQMSPSTQRVGGGAAIGALGGAAIGSFSGNAGLGALCAPAPAPSAGIGDHRHIQSRDRSFQQGYSAGRASGQ